MPSENLHPHWHATEEQPIPVRQKPQTAPRVQPQVTRTVSRRPAAIAGIMVVTIAGFFFFGGVDLISGALQGQVASAKTIHVYDEAIQPATLSVNPGETITFINESATPQILESDTFCSETGYCFATQTLFPGESENFTITQDFPAGTYTFASSTHPELTGEVTVVGNALTQQEFVTADQVIRDALTNNGPFEAASQLEQAQTMNSTSDVFPAAPEIPVTQANIPQNPYAVGSTRQHPFDASGEPIEELFEDSPVHSGAPKPMRQPETGAELWIVVAISLTTLYFFVRRRFAEVEIRYEN